MALNLIDMKEYRRKPETIRASQWFPGWLVEGVYGDDEGYYVRNDVNGKTYLNAGDYIIQLPINYKVVPKDDFEKTFEAIV